AQRAGAVAVEEVVAVERRGPALLQVLQRLAAPVAADGVGEGLAIAGRAVEVDHDHRVALAGVGLRVPAVAPAVAEAALRAAVDQERHRVALAGLVVPGLDHVAVDRGAAGALEAELLEGAEIDV